MKRSLTPLFAAVSMAVAAIAAPAQAEKINVFSGVSPVFGPPFVADVNGYFKDAGLDVTVRTFQAGAAATEAFRGGGARRQRTTPSTSGSGPVSTIAESSLICSCVKSRGRPAPERCFRPSGPSSLKRCAQSLSVWRSIPPTFAASVRLTPSYAAAKAKSRRTWRGARLRLAKSRRRKAVIIIPKGNAC